MAAQLIEVLQKTISSNPQDQQVALQFLEQAREQNLVEFVKQLAEVLHGTQNDSLARQAAGLQLKNALVAKDDSIRSEYQAKWLAIPLEVRQTVRQQVLHSLGTESSKTSAAAQCVAAIASAELPNGQWDDVITVLMHNVTNDGSSDTLKIASLEAIGYLCADLDPTILGLRSNEILTAIIHGMKKIETNINVRFAACTALFNSLEFTRSNFEADNERNVIMQVVCEATQCEDTRIRVVALQCLVKIMSCYYRYMEQYMGPALFAITVDAMKSDDDQIILQGIEFWSNVCDEEIQLACEAEEAAEQGRPPENVSKFYAKGALQYLVPLLTQTLTKQEEGDDEDEWNPSKAGGVCLMLLAQCTGDDVVPHVLPFITNNINSTDWRFRDAAVMAFGSILEGPDTEKLKPLVSQAMPMLIHLLQDENIVVKDTAAWCIGRICESAPDTVITPDVLLPLLPALSKALNQEPRVAANVCWAISSLAEAAYVAAQEYQQTDAEGHVQTYILSSCFEAIVNELLTTTERADNHQSNLRNAAYEALMELIKNSPLDCYAVVQKTTVVVLHRLQSLLSMETQIQSTNDRSQFHELQSQLCAALQSVMRKMKREDAPQISDLVMTSLLQVLAMPSNKGGVQEDALMAIATLIEVLGEDFFKYMEAFKPFLLTSLNNHEEYQVCTAAVGLIGDLCRGLGDRVIGFLDELMQCLVLILQDNKVEKSVKPPVIAAFGDVALAIGTNFTKYLQLVMTTCAQASMAQVDNNDFDAVEYLQELREATLEAYTGIVQGLKVDNTAANMQIFNAYLANIFAFLELISADANGISDGILSACIGLIGDICTAFGAPVLPALETERISELLTKGRRSKTTKVKSLASWSIKEIKKLKNNAAASA